MAENSDDALDAPGLKKRPRKSGDVYYWMPRTRDIEAGYKPASLRLNPAFTPEQRAAECRRLWAELQAWRQGEVGGPTPYSIDWLINRYQTDELSPYHAKRDRTKHSYDYLCRFLGAEIGKRLICPRVVGRAVVPNITGETVLRWHRAWQNWEPIEDDNGAPILEDGKPVEKPKTPSVARHAITMLRTLAKYGVIIAAPGAKEFSELLSTMEFPTTPPRDVAPMLDEVAAIVDQAERDGYLSIAIATQAQFDLIERRVSIIGYWEKGRWRPGWVWQNVREWVITYWQRKNGLVLREFDLRDTPRLLDLLQKVPEQERVGAVIKCERQRGTEQKGPWNERHYASVFRDICRRAGVRDEIKSMDMRAGGATEADLIEGVSDRMLQDAMGHADPRTKDRYRRQKQRNARNVVQLRQKARKE
jgi:hypothetical protein